MVKHKDGGPGLSHINWWPCQTHKVANPVYIADKNGDASPDAAKPDTTINRLYMIIV